MSYEIQLFEGEGVGSALVMYERGIVDAFITLYNAKGDREWSENWTVQSATEHVRRILSSAEGRIPVLALMLDVSSSRRVVGFLFGAVIVNPGALKRYGFPSAADEGIDPRLLDILETGIVTQQRFPLYVSVELGILKEFRGGLRPLTDLFVPVLKAARRNGCKHAIGWSAMGKRSLTLFRAFGGSVLAMLGGHKGIVYTKNRISTVLALIPFALQFQRTYMRIVTVLKKL